MEKLKDVQCSVPDKDFFKAALDESKKKKGEQKKRKRGPLFGLLSKREETREKELMKAREKIRNFHNSFAMHNRQGVSSKPKKEDYMSLSELKSYRKRIKKAAAKGSNDYRALDGIVTFIDLRNSGVTTDKQGVIQQCVKKVGRALFDNGGLSLFHVSWLLSIYREYLTVFKVFPKGIETNTLASYDGELVAKIGKLKRREREVAVYRELINKKEPDIKRIDRLSQDPTILSTDHGHRGCTWEQINQYFTSYVQEAESKASVSNLNDINIVMAYAMVFCRIPMLSPLVASIVRAIPNLNLTMKMYKQKIIISQKANQLWIAKEIYQYENYKEYIEKLLRMAFSTYDYCVKVIEENNLEKARLGSELYAFPFIRQASILIVYKHIFLRNESVYLEALRQSIELLESLMSDIANALGPLVKMYDLIETYKNSTEDIICEIESGKYRSD